MSLFELGGFLNSKKGQVSSDTFSNTMSYAYPLILLRCVLSHVVVSAPLPEGRLHATHPHVRHRIYGVAIFYRTAADDDKRFCAGVRESIKSTAATVRGTIIFIERIMRPPGVPL